MFPKQTIEPFSQFWIHFFLFLLSEPTFDFNRTRHVPSNDVHVQLSPSCRRLNTNRDSANKLHEVNIHFYYQPIVGSYANRSERQSGHVKSNCPKRTIHWDRVSSMFFHHWRLKYWYNGEGRGWKKGERVGRGDSCGFYEDR